MFIIRWLFLGMLFLITKPLAATRAKRLDPIQEERRASLPLVRHQESSQVPAAAFSDRCIEQIRNSYSTSCVEKCCMFLYCPLLTLIACCEYSGYFARPESYWKKKYHACLARTAPPPESNGEAKQ